MTDKFYLKEVCGEYKFFEEGDGFPLTEKQIVNKLNENEQLKDENKQLTEKIQLLQGELNADAKQYKIFIDIIDEADDLIMSHLSKHYQRKWRAFCKNREYDFE